MGTNWLISAVRIGKPIRRIISEPEPVREPVPEPTPAPEPVKEPAPV